MQARVRDWEQTFSTWAASPSKTEQERIENAIRAIRKAFDDDAKLSPVTKVFVQGSYRNRVNVTQDSDVDIGVLYTGASFGVQYPPGANDSTFGNLPADYTYSHFKDDIGRALVRRFGVEAVRRGNKAFDVHENTYRLDADVVPLFKHRRYSADGSYICGVELHPDTGARIINWPERLYDDYHWPNQHYENGLHKNTDTKRAYRGVVRILKRLRCEMDDAGMAAAKPLCGFNVECLTWNAPNDRFARPTWDLVVQAVLGHLWSNTRTDETCSEWGEVSELKYLFRGPGLTRADAHAFLHAAWSYVGVR